MILMISKDTTPRRVRTPSGLAILVSKTIDLSSRVWTRTTIQSLSGETSTTLSSNSHGFRVTASMTNCPQWK